MHSHISHSFDDGWVYFFPLYTATVYSQLTLWFKKKEANEAASHIRLSLHSTPKWLSWVMIGSLKHDGWALKASAVVKCQSPSEQGPEWKFQGWKGCRLFLQLLPKGEKKKKAADSSTGECFRAMAQAILLLASKQQMKIKNGISFPTAAKLIGVTSQIQKVSLVLLAKEIYKQ